MPEGGTEISCGMAMAMWLCIARSAGDRMAGMGGGRGLVIRIATTHIEVIPPVGTAAEDRTRYVGEGKVSPKRSTQ